MTAVALIGCGQRHQRPAPANTRNLSHGNHLSLGPTRTAQGECVPGFSLHMQKAPPSREWWGLSGNSESFGKLYQSIVLE